MWTLFLLKSLAKPLFVLSLNIILLLHMASSFVFWRLVQRVLVRECSLYNTSSQNFKHFFSNKHSLNFLKCFRNAYQSIQKTLCLFLHNIHWLITVTFLLFALHKHNCFSLEPFSLVTYDMPHHLPVSVLDLLPVLLHVSSEACCLPYLQLL